MRKISTDSLKPGMIVGRAIIADTGIALLNKGTVLNQSYIDKIIWNELDFIFI